MPESWSLTCFVLLTSITTLTVCRTLHPQQHKGQDIQKYHDTQISAGSPTSQSEGLTERKEAHGEERVKRETTECPVMEIDERSGLQKIADTSDETLNFFIEPKPGFSRLVFHMKVDNKLDFSSWKYAEKTLDISSANLHIDWSHPTWIPVEVEYFKKEKSFGRDRHALRVKVGEDVNDILITDWWRTHSYEGFAIYSEGPVKVLMCNPENAMAASVVGLYDEMERSVLLILSVLGACFLLVMLAVIGYLLKARCSNTSNIHPPPLPRFPKSWLLKHNTNRENDNDPIYESIDEGTLAKLRQNLDCETLSRPQCVWDQCRPSAERHVYTKAPEDQVVHGEIQPSQVPGGNAERKTELSLLEEKMALRQNSGLDSPLESHYVDMHGIVSRTSSLNK